MNLKDAVKRPVFDVKTINREIVVVKTYNQQSIQ